MATHKCAMCKKAIIQENSKIYYNGIDAWLCSNDCFTEYIKKQKTLEDKNAVLATLHRVFNYDGQFETKIFVEIERACKEYNLSYQQLNKVLHYMYDIQCIPVYRPTLYYVKDHVYAAQKYYQSIKKREEDIKRMKMAQQTAPVARCQPTHTNKRRTKLLLDSEEDVWE